MSNELNLKSSTIEAGIEIAKEFLGKLIMPAVEETGLLIKDQVTFWKFKNQVNILNKSKVYCLKHNIEPKKIQLKLLVPLIENSALEEDEDLQDKWAILLSNMVDSEQNIENHVFPYILGQMSKKELLFIENTYLSKKDRIRNLEFQLSEFKDKSIRLNKELDRKKVNYHNEKENAEYTSSLPIEGLNSLKSDYYYFIKKVRSLRYEEKNIRRKISLLEIIPNEELENFELSNLVRLGLIKEVRETSADNYKLKIPKEKENEIHRYNQDPNDEHLIVDVEIKLRTNIEYMLVELGELFIQACSEKE